MTSASAWVRVVGVGVGDPDAAPTFGRTLIWAEAAEVMVRSWLPKKVESSGVMSPNWLVTETVTSLPSASEHGDGTQVSTMSVGTIVTNEPSASRWTAQTTRLVETLHGWPAWYDAGFEAASRAPARAALSMEIVAREDARQVGGGDEQEQQDGQDEDEFDRRLTTRSTSPQHLAHGPHHPITPPMGPASRTRPATSKATGMGTRSAPASRPARSRRDTAPGSAGRTSR